MKSRTADFESKKAKKIAKNGPIASKENSGKAKTMHRRLKSEERTTSIYLNPNQKKTKVYHEKSASNRIPFKNDFDDYIHVSTTRKTKNSSKKQKLDGTLPVVGNNSFGGYNSNINPIFSMLSSLNNSGALLTHDQSSTMDKNSLNVNNKAQKGVVVKGPMKGKQFSGMKTTMLNYVNDLDYKMNDSHKDSLHMNSEQMHNYSVNYQKSGKKKPLMLTSQKSSKRRSVNRDNSKKQKRSASDNTRSLSSKRRKKEHTKSPSSHSAYYNKMMLTSNSNAAKFQGKGIRKVVSKNGKIYHPQSSIMSKKSSKDHGSKKKISNYYGSHHISKSNDARQKFSSANETKIGNIRSLPLSLMNSYEKNGQEKSFKKKYKNNQIQNYKKVPNQVFYQKGKVNVSGQHLKFSKPKSKTNMSQHSENSNHQFSKSLAFSGGNTPISPPFYHDSKTGSLISGSKKGDKLAYNFISSQYPKSSGTGMSYDNMGYPTYHQIGIVQRPETNVNVYDEEMSFLSSGENSKHHSFYQDASNSFQSQTYDNPNKKNAKREALKGYSYCSETNSKKRMIMDKKTKISKISEIMGHKDFNKKPSKKAKRQSKSGFQRKFCSFKKPI